MGGQCGPFVLSLTLKTLSAQCDELQARSARLNVEAGLLTAHLRDLNEASAKLRALFPRILKDMRRPSSV
jgi:hypothetical protein